MIIGITGAAGAGKDEIAKILGLEKDSFAAPIKDIASKLFDIPIEDFETQEGKASKHPNGYGWTNREILQKIGTDMFRNHINDAVWVDSLKRRAEGSDICIPDVRFLDEAQAIRDMGGIVIKVIGAFPGYTPIEGSSHASEAGIPDDACDIVITNDSDVPGLVVSVGMGLRELFVGHALRQLREGAQTLFTLSMATPELKLGDELMIQSEHLDNARQDIRLV